MGAIFCKEHYYTSTDNKLDNYMSMSCQVAFDPKYIYSESMHLLQ